MRQIRIALNGIKRARFLMNSKHVGNKCDIGKIYTDYMIMAGHIDHIGNPLSRKMKQLAGQF